MCYKILFLCILFFIHAHSRTDLSKSKCPDMFSLANANVTKVPKQQSITMSANFYSIYDNDNLKISIEDMVLNGSSKSLNNLINNRMTVYIIVIVIFIVIFITSGICCTF